MYSEVIKYTDFEGNEQSERLYFNITKTELQKENLFTNGGLQSYLKRIISSKNQVEICKYFEHIVDMSYGIKTDDKHFLKNEKILNEFKSSAAYDAWFFKLTTDADYAAKFINAIMPKDFSEEASKMSEEDKNRLKEEFALSDI